MANRLYIGARYIPIPFNNPDGSYNWLPGVAYEGLTIVIYDHRSYISKKPVPAISTPPSEDTYHWVDAYLFNADVAEALLSIAELQETKADKDGVYDSLWAGELISKDRQTDNTPYLFRNTGGNLKRIAPLAYPTLVGASVAENQLCNGESVTVPNGHKYYLKKSNTESLGESTGTAITGLTSGSDMVIDLTQKLGSTIADYVYSLETATAGSGIAWLRSYGFLKGYQAYNSGSIESVEVTEKKCVGFNQWDEEVVNGYWDVSTGEYTPSANWMASKNHIPVLPNTQYYIKGDESNTSSFGAYVFYDANKNYISGSNENHKNTIFTTPANCHYMTFYADNVYNGTDICINLSNTDRNGEYEAYTSQTYALGSDVLRGIFKLDANNNLYADGDRKKADGTITRKYEEVTYDGSSDENWNVETTRYGKNFYIRISDAKPLQYKTSMIFDRFEACSTLQVESGKCFISATKNLNLTVGDLLGISTVADFKTWLTTNPVSLVYELQTPTTETSTPFTSPQLVYPDGTEEFITENHVPVGHETEYQYDLVGMLENLIKVPDVPSTNGTYKLQAVRTAPGVTYNWVTD